MESQRDVTRQRALPNSVLGQLQRGRGDGYRRALQLPKDKASELLVECITHDPRLDCQVEAREHYYASLAMEIGLDLKPLSDHLREHDDQDQCGWNTPLTVMTLGALAKRGYRAAVPILCDYLAWGEWWRWPLDDLLSNDDPVVEAQVAQAIERRYAADDQLEEALSWFDLAVEPWANLAKRSPRIAALSSKPRKQSGFQVASPASTPNYTSLPISELLAMADPRNRHKLCKVVARLAKPADVDLLLANVSLEQPYVAGVALAGLERLAPRNIFNWLHGFYVANPEMPGWVRAHASGVFEALPSDLTLPLAREWLNKEDWHLRHLAEQLFEKHATPEDVPLLRAAIAQALRDEEEYCYRLCSLVEAFTRFPELGEIPELVDVYTQAIYSYGRKLAAEAIAVTAPNSFRSNFAEECLWDCEAGTRELGAQEVPVSSTTIQARLAVMASDAYEEEDVRDAAKARKDR